MPCEAERKEYDDAYDALQRFLNDADHTPDDVNLAQLRFSSADEALKKCEASPIFPSPLTRVGQCLVNLGKWIYLFAVDPEGRILYTKWELGSAGVEWREIPGEFRTDAAPAAVAMRSTPYLFVTVKGLGPNGGLFLNQGGLNPEGDETWAGWQEV